MKYKLKVYLGGGEDLKFSSNAKDILFTHMDSLAIQMDVLSSLSKINKETVGSIDCIIKSIKKGRCVNRKIENLISEQKDNVKEEAVL